MKHFIRYYIAILMLTVFTLSAMPEEVKLIVEMPRGRRSIAVGDDFWIRYIVKDLKAAPAAPSSVAGCEVKYFNQRGSSSSFSSINGKVTQSFSAEYAVMVRAVKEGKYTFGPVTVGGVQSNTVSYTIGAAGSNAVQTPGMQHQQLPAQQGQGLQSGPKFIGKGDSQLFMKANVSKTTAYEQEALVYTVKLYTTYSGIRFIGAASAPAFDGFVIEESKDISQQLDYETYNGKTYATAIIARYIIFPQMKGNLIVKGNTYTVAVNETEYYHDPFFGTQAVSNPIQLNVTPNDLHINVKELPAPQPDNFSGGVGKFTLSAYLPASELKTGQAASVVYTVKGSGNLKYVTLPDLNKLFPSQLEVYSPETTLSTNVSSANLAGEAKFEYSFMPLEAGDYRIPDVTLVYFDPSTGRYERSVAKGFDVVVDKGRSASGRTLTESSFDSKLIGIESGVYGSPLFIKSPFYWLWYLLPAILFIIALVVYRRYISMHSDMLSLRSRKAGKVASKRLKKAAAAMHKDNTAQFYDEILDAFWGYIGDKLKIPGSELNRDNVSGKLSDVGIDSDVISRLIHILDECEFAKYAPSVTAHDNMNGIYNEATDIIETINTIIKKNKQ